MHQARFKVDVVARLATVDATLGPAGRKPSARFLAILAGKVVYLS